MPQDSLGGWGGSQTQGKHKGGELFLRVFPPPMCLLCFRSSQSFTLVLGTDEQQDGGGGPEPLFPCSLVTIHVPKELVSHRCPSMAEVTL